MEELNPPGFRVYHDELRHRLVVPTRTGFRVYTMDGELIKSNETITAGVSMHTASFIFSPKDTLLSANTSKLSYKRFLITDTEGRVKVFHSSEKIISEFMTRNSDFLFSEFLTTEFVILVSSSNEVILLDIKTGKNMTVQKLPGPPKIIRLFGGRSPRLCTLIANTFYVFRLKNPWSLFRRLSASPVIIRRCISQNRAARLCVLTSNSFLSMFSPSLGQFLMSAGAKVPSRITDFIYDRGVVRYNESVLDTSSHERLFFITEDKKVLAFRENNDSWEYDKQLEMSPRIVTVGVAFEPPRLVFCCFADAGDLLVYDYEDFSPLTRVSFDQKVPLFVHFHYGTGLLLIVYHNEIVGMDLKTFQITFRERTKEPLHAAFDDDICLFCYSDYSVVVLELGENGFTEIASFTTPEEIKFVSIESHVFMVVTTMNTIMFGQTAEDITTIEAPYDVSAVSILNPELDLLIGLDKELMVLRRDDVFPWMEPILHCPEDDDDPQKEEYVIFKKTQIDNFQKMSQIRTMTQRTNATTRTTMTNATYKNNNEKLIKQFEEQLEPVEEYEEKPMPQLDRKTLLREMERITDHAELPQLPDVVTYGESCIIDQPRFRRIVRPRPTPETEEKKEEPKEEKPEEKKNDIMSLLEQYKDVLDAKKKSQTLEKTDENGEEKETEENNANEEKESETNNTQETEKKPEKKKRKSSKSGKTKTKTTKAKKPKTKKKSKTKKHKAENENENDKEEEKQNAVKEEGNEENQQNEEEYDEETEEEQTENNEKEEKDENAEKEEKPLESPVSVTNLEIIAKDGSDKNISKEGVINLRTSQNSKVIDTSRLSTEFRKRQMNKPFVHSQALFHTLKPNDSISMTISHLKKGEDGKQNLSQTMKIAFEPTKDVMPLFRITQKVKEMSNYMPSDPGKIVENEGSSDDEVIEHYATVVSPKKMRQSCDVFAEALKNEGQKSDTETNDEHKETTENEAENPQTPKKGENVDEFLGGPSPQKEKPHISFTENENEAGEGFDELVQTNFIRKQYDVESGEIHDDADGNEYYDSQRHPQSQDTPRKMALVHPPDPLTTVGGGTEVRRSRSPQLVMNPLLPIPPLSPVKDDTEYTPVSPLKQHLEQLDRQRNYPGSSRGTKNRNPRFSRKHNYDTDYDRLEDIDLQRDSRRHGTIYTGRAAMGGPVKPLGDIEMAVIIQPLPRKAANPFARKKK